MDFLKNIVDFVDFLTDYRRDPNMSISPERPEFILRDEQEGCKSGVYACECLEPLAAREGERDLDKQYRQLAFVRKTLIKRNLFDKELLQALKVLKSHTCLITVKRPDNEMRIFEGNKKGLARYNKKMSAKIRDTVSEMVERGYECFFATTTCDPDAVRNNRLIAWQTYYQEFMQLLKKERNHKGLKVVWVLESTKKGYPHIHAIIGYPKGTYKNYDKIPCNKRLKFGAVVDLFKKSQMFRVFEVKKPSDNGIKWYLTKYITKTTTEDIFSLIGKQEDLSDDERKMLYSLIYTTATKRRLFGLCRFEKNQKPGSALTASDAEVAEQSAVETSEDARVEKALRSRARMGRARPFLRKLCNNFPCLEKNSVHCLGANDVPPELSNKVYGGGDLTPKDFEVLHNKGRQLSCGGCFYSHLCNFVLTGRDDYINITLCEIDGKPYKLFQPEDFADDDRYMERIYILVKVFVNFTQDFGGTFKSWQNREVREAYLRNRQLNRDFLLFNMWLQKQVIEEMTRRGYYEGTIKKEVEKWERIFEKQCAKVDK